MMGGMTAYAAGSSGDHWHRRDGTVWGDAYLMEKLETGAGWSAPAPDEPWAHGHLQQIQDFVEAVAYDRAPLSDGQLGSAVVRVIYAAYVAAEEGRRVDLRDQSIAARAGGPMQ